MKHLKFGLVFFIIFGYSNAQNKNISLKEIWSGAFSQERLQSLQSLNDGQSYIVQDYNTATGEMRVDVFNYQSGEKTGELLNSGNI